MLFWFTNLFWTAPPPSFYKFSFFKSDWQNRERKREMCRPRDYPWPFEKVHVSSPQAHEKKIVELFHATFCSWLSCMLCVCLCVFVCVLCVCVCVCVCVCCHGKCCFDDPYTLPVWHCIDLTEVIFSAILLASRVVAAQFAEVLGKHCVPSATHWPSRHLRKWTFSITSAAWMLFCSTGKL